MRWHAATTVANGGAPNGPPRCCPGDRDGHLMPLSPTVRSRYDNTVPHCSATVPALLQLPPLLHFYPFSLMLTPVGDPFAYKRRPVCNVEGVHTFRDSDRHTLGAAALRAPELPSSIQPSRSRVLRVHRGPNLGKPPVCSPRSALRAPSAPLTGQRKGLRPHRWSGGTPSAPTPPPCGAEPGTSRSRRR